MNVFILLSLRPPVVFSVKWVSIFFSFSFLSGVCVYMSRSLRMVWYQFFLCFILVWCYGSWFLFFKKRKGCCSFCAQVVCFFFQVHQIVNRQPVAFSLSKRRKSDFEPLSLKRFMDITDQRRFPVFLPFYVVNAKANENFTGEKPNC